MHLIGRLFVGALALLLAVPAGAGVLLAVLLLSPGAGAWFVGLVGTGIDGALADLAAGLPPEGFALLVAGLARAAFAVLVVPPVLVALVGEGLRRRSLLWYGGGCGLLTAAVPWLARGGPAPGGGVPAAEASLTAALFAAGAGAGWVYWLVAGRRGGRA